MGAAISSTEIKKCGELTQKHKDGEKVEWPEFQDLAQRMEIDMLHAYRTLENLRLHRAISNSEMKESVEGERLQLYRDAVMSNVRTYVLPYATDDEKKEIDEINKGEMAFPSDTELPIMMLEMQFIIESNHKFVELIRTSSSVEEYVAKHDEANDLSQQSTMNDAAAKLMLPLSGVDPSMVQFWMSRV